MSGTVTAGCEGDAKWKVNSGSQGTVHCTAGVTKSMQMGTFAPGNYTVAANFDNGHGVRSSASSMFTVASSQSSATGVYIPMTLSVLVLAFLILRRQGADEGFGSRRRASGS